MWACYMHPPICFWWFPVTQVIIWAIIFVMFGFWKIFWKFITYCLDDLKACFEQLLIIYVQNRWVWERITKILSPIHYPTIWLNWARTTMLCLVDWAPNLFDKRKLLYEFGSSTYFHPFGKVLFCSLEVASYPKTPPLWTGLWGKKSICKYIYYIFNDI